MISAKGILFYSWFKGLPSGTEFPKVTSLSEITLEENNEALDEFLSSGEENAAGMHTSRLLEVNLAMKCFTGAQSAYGERKSEAERQGEDERERGGRKAALNKLYCTRL